MVLKNSVFEEIATTKPTSVAMLRHIKGMDVKKKEAFGNELWSSMLDHKKEEA